METNQGVKTVLMQQAEVGVRKLLESLQSIEEGDLKGLEQKVLETIFAVGRGWMESILSEPAPEERAASQRRGSCGHAQQLEGYRPKQVLTLLGKVTFRRAYYRCVGAAERAEMAGAEADADTQEACTHGEAPADKLWGLQGQRTSAGVQQAASYLCASLTLEEAAETLSWLLPLQMSARQALNLMQPLGQALQQQEDEQVRALWAHAIHARTSSRAALGTKQDRIERLYIELDGVLARLRRGSVPLEEQERKRKGDVYREVKVGAVFEATGGPARSELAPGVFVDQAGPKHSVARRGKAEDFGKLLYALAVTYGLERADQLVVLGDGATWIWRLVAEHFPGAVQIVDLWHAGEHVWKVARAAFGANTLEASAWAEHACSLLVEGKVEDLVEEIVILPPVPPEPGTSRSVPEIERDSFISNAARMRYPAFRAQGMHVGSRSYGKAIEEVIVLVWESLDYICAERLTPILLTTAQHVVRLGAVKLTREVEEQLQTISRATVSRVLRTYRSRRRRLPEIGAERANQVTKGVPMGRLAWDLKEPGHFEVDLVYHSGASTTGEYGHTIGDGGCGYRLERARGGDGAWTTSHGNWL